MHGKLVRTDSDKRVTEVCHSSAASVETHARQHMPSITRRAAVLILCRILNYGIMFLSPIFLTRIFGDLHAYGQYREFITYAALITGVIDFSINTNLIYFIAKYPDRERQSVTHTAFLILIASVVGATVVYLFRGLILAKASYDFSAPLIAYILFFLNFEYLEAYLLGRKRTDYILYYSSSRIIVRTAALLVSAILSRDVMTVIWTLVMVELVKDLFVFSIIRRVFTRRFDRSLLGEQIRFIVPLGFAVVLTIVNTQLANLYISIRAGVERLALYAIAGLQIPVIDIVRSSVMDVLFPEMAQAGNQERLHLWRRANVILCVVVFPIYAIFLVHAHTYIKTLFKSTYLPAVPLFRIYLTLMLVRCFELGTPIRAINKNNYFIFGSVLNLVVNLGLILLFYRSVGFIMPAIAFIIGECVTAAYLANRILHCYNITLRSLFLWKKVFAILCCAVLALPFLVIGRWIDLNSVIRAVAFSLLYLLVYYLAIRRLKMEEVEILVEKLSGRLRGMRKGIIERLMPPPIH
jgi:O-antigen/teichoic acid export membrane protein